MTSPSPVVVPAVSRPGANLKKSYCNVNHSFPTVTEIFLPTDCKTCLLFEERANSICID